MLVPVIVSASRATDIPAFHGDWFAKRLDEGFCLWRNPFNNTTVEVSFAKTRFFVFWSKNPEPFLPLLPRLDAKGFGYYFQFTLNDYEQEGLEPGVPAIEKRLDTFKRLSERLGPERVVWRFDPIALSETVSPEEIAGRIERIASALKDFTRKLVISFIDIAKYRNARRNMSGWHEPSEEEIFSLAAKISALGRSCGLEVATCAEAVDLELYGISHNSCIDRELILRVFPDLASLLPVAKDKGQRKSCLCAVSKDIGSYGTCPHGCLYCYANGSRSLM